MMVKSDALIVGYTTSGSAVARTLSLLHYNAAPWHTFLEAAQTEVLPLRWSDRIITSSGNGQQWNNKEWWLIWKNFQSPCTGHAPRQRDARQRRLGLHFSSLSVVDPSTASLSIRIQSVHALKCIESNISFSLFPRIIHAISLSKWNVPCSSIGNPNSAGFQIRTFVRMQPLVNSNQYLNWNKIQRIFRLNLIWIQILVFFSFFS